MKKEKILLLAAMCAIAFTGCKKKDPVDLSSLHTTAAVEKETMPATESPETTAAVTESTVSGENSGSKFAIQSTPKTYTGENASVEYPEITNMKDVAKQKQVNELLRRNAEAVTKAYPAKEGETLSVISTVEAANLKRITVTYKGELKAGAKTTRIFFTNAIDLDTAQNLRLSDYTDAYTTAGYIASGDYKLETAAGSDETALRAYINASDKTTDYYYKKLGAADFSGGYTETETAVTWPEVFSYEKQGVIYVSIPVSAELGDYVIIRYSPDNK